MTESNPRDNVVEVLYEVFGMKGRDDGVDEDVRVDLQTQFEWQGSEGRGVVSLSGAHCMTIRRLPANDR